MPNESGYYWIQNSDHSWEIAEYNVTIMGRSVIGKEYTLTVIEMCIINWEGPITRGQ